MSKAALTGLYPIIYARVSNDEQDATGSAIRDQVAGVASWLAEKGVITTKQAKDIKAASKMPRETSGRRKGRFVKNMSVVRKKWALFIDRGYKGTDYTRPQLLAAIALAEEKPSQSFIVVSDFQRWSRDARKGIDLLWLVQVALGAAEVEKARSRERRTREQLKERGVYTSARLALDPFAREDPWSVMMELLPQVEAKEMTERQFGKAVSERTAPNGPQPTWYVRALPKLKRIMKKLSPEDFELWNFWRTKVRNYERDKGFEYCEPYPCVENVGDYDELCFRILLRIVNYLV
jgi:hypothetical protein